MRIFILAFLAITSVSFSAEPAAELNNVICLYYKDINDDPYLYVQFKYPVESESFIGVKVVKMNGDIEGRVLYENEEQIATSAQQYSIGIDDFNMVISRPIPGFNKAKKTNAKMKLPNYEKTYRLNCESRN